MEYERLTDPNDRMSSLRNEDIMERIEQGIAQLEECRTRTAEAAGAGPATLTNRSDANDRAIPRPGYELGTELGHGERR